MALHFSRDTKVYVESSSTVSTDVLTVWEVPVLDGFSMSQATNSSEITINEAGSTSRRARLVFNDSLAPVEWSFTTYMRPFLSPGGDDYTTSRVHAVEEALWGMYAAAIGFDGDDVWRATTGTPISYSTTTSMTVSLDSTNIPNYPEDYNIFVSLSDGDASENVYKITEAVVNSVTADFDIDGIATLTWSGFGSLLQDQQNISPQRTATTHDEGVTDTGAFIRTRTSDVTLTRTDSPETYSLILTGGSINFENNMTYLTPEEIGLVNQPLGNVTGPRSISGTLTCYLDTAEASPNPIAELLADLVADTTTVRNVFNLDIYVGGSGNTPAVQFSVPTAHLEIPAFNVEDVFSLEITWHAITSGGDIDLTNEATVVYTAA